MKHRRKGPLSDLIGRTVLVPAAEFRERNKPSKVYPGKILKKDSRPRHMVVRLDDGSRYHWPVEQLHQWLDAAAPAAALAAARPSRRPTPAAADVAAQPACSADEMAVAETLASLSQQIVAEGTSRAAQPSPPPQAPTMQATASSQRYIDQCNYWLQQHMQMQQQQQGHQLAAQAHSPESGDSGGTGGPSSGVSPGGNDTSCCPSRQPAMRSATSCGESHSQHVARSPPDMGTAVRRESCNGGPTSSQVSGTPACLTHADVGVPPTLSHLAHAAPLQGLDAGEQYNTILQRASMVQHAPWLNNQADGLMCLERDAVNEQYTTLHARYAAHPSLECFLRCLQQAMPMHPWVWDPELGRAGLAALRPLLM